MSAGSRLAIVLTACLLPQLGCASDPAVRLARCLERSTDRGRLADSCEVGSAEGFAVVAHPAGSLSDGQLAAAGLTAREIGVLRELRIGPEPSIYVIPESGRASRTTAQGRAVGIPGLLVARKAGGTPVSYSLLQSDASPVLDRLE